MVAARPAARAAAATAPSGRLLLLSGPPPQAPPARSALPANPHTTSRRGSAPSVVAGAASGDRKSSGALGKVNGRRAPESIAAAACEEAAPSVVPRFPSGQPVVPGAFSTVPEALEAVARGEAVVVLDDEDRENEGDLIFAAELATPELLAFTVRYTSGVICVGMRGEDLDRLEIPLMVEAKENEDAMQTAFAITVDAKEGTSTGISASDRAVTIRALASPDSVPQSFNKPGHIFPLRCREGGVLRRPGHTEASVDLARLSGCSPAGVLCEIVNDDGTMARTPDLLEFGAVHGLHVITIKDLVRHIQEQETASDALNGAS